MKAYFYLTDSAAPGSGRCSGGRRWCWNESNGGCNPRAQFNYSRGVEENRGDESSVTTPEYTEASVCTTHENRLATKKECCTSQKFDCGGLS